jgi:lipoprotein-releasing system permease protein
MFHPLVAFIGLRYTRHRRNRFVSFISAISMVGIALGIMALITVLSVMNGFQRELRERILSLTAHARVTAVDGALADWRDLRERVLETPGVAAAAPYIQSEIMLMQGDTVGGALLSGILPDAEAAVADIAGQVVDGDLAALQPGGFGIVLGRDLAYQFGVEVGDRITVVSPRANVTPAGLMPRLKRFTVVGVFATGMLNYDRAMAFAHLDDVARLFRLSGPEGLRLRLADIFQAPQQVQALRAGLGSGLRVQSWADEHATFFRAVQIEKTTMFVILTLIVAVAAFNIVSTLVMVVTEKQGDIAILRTLGTSPAGILGIFVVQGAGIGLVGTLLGLLGGLLLAANVEWVVASLEHLLGMRVMSPEIYLISELPSEIIPGDVLGIAVVAFLLTVAATLYPAYRAARVQPAGALRYE